MLAIQFTAFPEELTEVKSMPAQQNIPLVVLAGLVATLAGCGSKAEPETPAPKKDNVETPDPKPEQPPPKKKQKPPVEKRKYGGFTIAEWSTRLKNIDPTGADGRKSVEGLTALIADEDVPAILRRRAAVTLGMVGRSAASAVPKLAEILKKHNAADGSGDEESTLIALKTLTLLGRFAKEATPELVDVLDNHARSVDVRKGALEALSRIGKADTRAVQAVVQSLTLPISSGMSDYDWYQLRGLAAQGVEMIGPTAAPWAILPLRRGAQNRRDDEFRRKCVVALGAIKTRDVVVPLIERLTKDFTPAVQQAAADALANLGPPAVPALRKLLKHEDKKVAALATESLGKIGPPAKDALDDLDYALDDPDGRLRLNAAVARWRITGDPDKAVPALIEELENPNRQIRMQSYRLFKELGPKAKKHEFALKRLLNDKRGYVRLAARKALQAIQEER